MPALTTFVIDNLLDLTLNAVAYTTPANHFITIHTTPPAADGTGTEVTGGGYTREAITFAAAAAGEIVSSNAPSWTPLHSGSDQVIVGWSIWDASTAGNMLAFHQLPSALTVRAGHTLTYPTAAITITSVGLAITDYLADKWLDHLLRTSAFTAPASTHVGQFTATPTRTSAGTEVSGGGYARQPATWTTPTAQTAATASDLAWSPLHTSSSQDLTGWEVMDAATAGNGLFFGDWDSGNQILIPAGDDAEAPTGWITVSVF